MAGVLALVTRAPQQRSAVRATRGHRLVAVAPGAVRGIEVTLDARRFEARRVDGGWQIDGRSAGPGTVAALDDLVNALATLRVVDVFRARDDAGFGFATPRASIVLRTPGRERRVLFGGPNVAGSTLYARRESDPRVMQVGIGVVGEIERVFYQRDRERDAADGR